MKKYSSFIVPVAQAIWYIKKGITKFKFMELNYLKKIIGNQNSAPLINWQSKFSPFTFQLTQVL